MPKPQPQYTFKCVMLGDCSVGKTAIINRYINKDFNNAQQATIGASYYSSNIDLDKCNVCLQLWDTAGQERFNAIAPFYYRTANCVIIVFDITNEFTQTKARAWVDEIQNTVPDCMLVLVGNKIDLNNSKIQYIPEEIQQYAKGKGITYVETSAFTGQNIDSLFLQIAKQIPKNKQGQEQTKLEPIDDPKKQGCC
ncbi:Rab1a [Hexamita inflata]|uniref:Rab1a n=1 Tax=Hexamita inflata TaxID=28002 RepID=A0AA86NFS8_9EUKA|nr:Rab1a [Hexamita inflata]CAI9929522.1 Rab1a [Hexamita inflata]